MAIIKVRGDFFSPEHSTALRDFGFNQSAGRPSRVQAPAEEAMSSIPIPYGMENYAQDAGTYVGRQAFAKGGAVRPKHDDEKQDRALIKSMIAKEEKGERIAKAKGGRVKRARFEEGGDAGGSDASGGNGDSGGGTGAEGSASTPADYSMTMPGGTPVPSARPAGPPPVAPPSTTHTPGERSGFQTVSSWPEWDARAAIVNSDGSPTQGDAAPAASAASGTASPQDVAAALSQMGGGTGQASSVGAVAGTRNPTDLATAFRAKGGRVTKAKGGRVKRADGGASWSNVDRAADGGGRAGDDDNDDRLGTYETYRSNIQPMAYYRERSESPVRRDKDDSLKNDDSDNGSNDNKMARGGRAIIPRSMKSNPLQAHSPIGIGSRGSMGSTRTPTASDSASPALSFEPAADLGMKRGGSVNTPPRDPQKTRIKHNIMPGGEMAYGMQPSTEPGGLKKGGRARRA